MLAFLRFKDYNFRYQFLFFLVIGSLYLPNYINTLFIILFALNGLISEHFIRHYRENPNKHFVLLSFLLFGTYALSLTYTSDIDQGLRQLQTMSVFFFVPLTYISNSYENLLKLRKPASIFYVITTLVTLATFWVISIVEGISFRAAGVSYIHPGYLSVFIGVSFFISLLYIPKAKTLFQKIAIIAISLIQITAIFLLVGRINIIALVLILLGFFTVKLIRKKKYLVVALLYLGTALSLVLIYRYGPDKFSSRFEKAVSSDEGNSLKIDDSRIYIWEAASNIIAKNFWIGVGIGDTEEALVNEYSLIGFEFGTEKKFNSHSQVLQTQLGTGVAGSLILLLLFFLLLWKSYQNRDDLLFCIALYIIISMSTESVFIRHWGVTAFTCLLLFMAVSTTKKAA